MCLYPFGGETSLLRFARRAIILIIRLTARRGRRRVSGRRVAAGHRGRLHVSGVSHGERVQDRGGVYQSGENRLVSFLRRLDEYPQRAFRRQHRDQI